MASVLQSIVGGTLNSAESFAETTVISAIKNLLLTRQGTTGAFDPVWKMTVASVVDPNTGNAGNPAQNVAGDPGGANAPKLKFNYTVLFNFNKTITTALQQQQPLNGTSGPNDPRLGSALMDKMVFQVKTASRPNPSVVYQDVNFYNYRTKVAVKVDYGTCTITFYDDVSNNAHDIFTLYLQAISPIANIQNALSSAPYFDGTAVSGTVLNGDPSVSSLGPLENGQEAGLINSITVVHQLPLQYSVGSTGTVSATLVDDNGNPIGDTIAGSTAAGTSPGIQANTVQYVYMNPKIVNFNLDDLDMTQSDVSTVSLTFTYDTVYISTVPIAFDLANSASATTVSPIASQSFLSNLTQGLVPAGVTGAATAAVGTLARVL